MCQRGMTASTHVPEGHEGHHAPAHRLKQSHKAKASHHAPHLCVWKPSSATASTPKTRLARSPSIVSCSEITVHRKCTNSALTERQLSPAVHQPSLAGYQHCHAVHAHTPAVYQQSTDVHQNPSAVHIIGMLPVMHALMDDV